MAFQQLIGDQPEGPTGAPPFEPNVGMHLEIDFGVKGLMDCTAVAILNFAPAEAFDGPVAEPLPFLEGGTDVFLPQPIATMLPPRLLNMAFRTTDDRGNTISFVDSFSEAGAVFDPTLGPYGGFQIAGSLDGGGDGVRDDNDGALFFRLLADARFVPDAGAPNSFDVVFAEPDSIAIYDAQAFEVPQPLPGDYDFDGVVDAADLGVWTSQVGQTGADLDGDGDFDGDVDGADLLIWQRQLGSAPVVATSGTVPEPATLMLIVLAAAGVATRRRWCAWRVSNTR
jgi:hypothetical protein